MSLLEVDQIRKSFDGVTAVDGLSFEIRPGEVFGLLGPNGAGKTTTMSIIAGLLAADAGELRFQGTPVQPGSGPLRHALGVVPQELAIYPDLTAFENLSFFGRLYGVRGTELSERIAWALERAALTQHADRPSRTFSGGMKRRLNFAIALLHRPQLLMLDEPTVGVDPQSRAYLLDCVRQLRDDDGVSVLYASHYMEEVEAISDRVAIVDHGRLVACGTLNELLQKLHVDIRVRFHDEPGDDPTAALQALDTVSGVDESRNGSTPGERTLIVHTVATSHDETDIGAIVSSVLALLQTHRRRVISVTTHDSDLERLFLELTGRSLRD